MKIVDIQLRIHQSIHTLWGYAKDLQPQGDYSGQMSIHLADINALAEGHVPDRWRFGGVTIYRHSCGCYLPACNEPHEDC